MKRWCCLLLALTLLSMPALADTDLAERVNALLAQMTCPGACTYVVAIINNHPKERDALLALDAEALPALSQILVEGERGLRLNMAEVFVDEILSRRRDLEQTPADAEAKEAILAFTGHEYKPHGPNPDWAAP